MRMPIKRTSSWSHLTHLIKLTKYLKGRLSKHLQYTCYSQHACDIALRCLKHPRSPGQGNRLKSQVPQKGKTCTFTVEAKVDFLLFKESWSHNLYKQDLRLHWQRGSLKMICMRSSQDHQRKSKYPRLQSHKRSLLAGSDQDPSPKYSLMNDQNNNLTSVLVSYSYFIFTSMD